MVDMGFNIIMPKTELKNLHFSLLRPFCMDTFLEFLDKIVLLYIINLVKLNQFHLT